MMHLEELKIVWSTSSDQSSFLEALGLEEVEDEELGAVTSAGETTTAEVGVRTGRAAVFILLSPLISALMDLFQIGVGANRGVLEGAPWGGPTDSNVDSATSTSWVVEAGDVSSASIVHARTRGSTTPVYYTIG